MAYHFIAKFGVYPIGSFVKTSQNEMGIVAGHRPDDSLQPRVLVVLDADRKRLEPEEKFVDLARADPGEEGQSPSILCAADPDIWGISPQEFMLAAR